MKLKILSEGVRYDSEIGVYRFDFTEDRIGDLLRLQNNNISQIPGTPLYYGFTYSETDGNVEQGDVTTLQTTRRVLLLIDKIIDESSPDAKIGENTLSGGYGYETSVGKTTHNLLKIIKSWGQKIPHINEIDINKRFNGYDELLNALIDEIYKKYPDAEQYDDVIQIDSEIQNVLGKNEDAIKRFKKLIMDLNTGIRRGKIGKDDLNKFIDLATTNIISNLGNFDLVVYPQSKSLIASKIATSLANKLGVEAVNGFEKVKLSFNYEKYKSDYENSTGNGEIFTGPWPLTKSTIIWRGGRLVKSLGDLLNNDKSIKTTGLLPWAKPYVKSQQLSDSILSHLENDSNVIIVDDVYNSGETLLSMTKELSDIVSGTVIGYALVKI